MTESEMTQLMKNIQDVSSEKATNAYVTQKNLENSPTRQLLRNQVAIMKAICCILRSDHAGQEMRGAVLATLKILGDSDV
jgi:hypothetical protein